MSTRSDVVTAQRGWQLRARRAVALVMSLWTDHRYRLGAQNHGFERIALPGFVGRVRPPGRCGPSQTGEP